jgi:hypothetical protein
MCKLTRVQCDWDCPRKRDALKEVERSLKKWTWAQDGSGFPRFSHVFSLVSRGRIDIVTDVCVEVYVSACPKYFCSPGWQNKAACMAWASQLWWGLHHSCTGLGFRPVLIFGIFEMFFLNTFHLERTCLRVDLYVFLDVQHVNDLPCRILQVPMYTV